jgi:LysR family transcriptional regulator, pca operon transcriptional activator
MGVCAEIGAKSRYAAGVPIDTDTKLGTRLARRLKLQHLRVIAAIADKGSLLQAAAALRLTQPAITRSLHEIEIIIGGRLFQRHKRGVLATDLGERLVFTAQRVLAELCACESAIQSVLGEDNLVLSVGALPAAAVGIVPGVIARLQAQSAKVQVRIVQGQTDELLAALATADLDLVAGRLYVPETPDQFERTALYEDIVTVLARADHPAFGESGPLESRLRHYPVALPARTPFAAEEIDEFVQRFELRQSVYLESNSIPLIRELLLTSDAVTIVPRMMFAGDLMRGALREIIALKARGGRPCGIIRRRDSSLSVAAARFAEAMRAHLVGLSASTDPGGPEPNPAG